MEERIFKGSTVEECLELASEELSISRENITYTVVEEKKSFFKRNASIIVRIEAEKKTEVGNGTVRIENGSVIVTNPKEGGRPATLVPTNNVKLLIDGEEVRSRHEIFEESVIEFHFHENEARRSINISTSPDKMKAFISIEYSPKIVYKLKEQNEGPSAVIEAEKGEEVYPPKFTIAEIKGDLAQLGIVRGIIDEKLSECLEKDHIVNLLIAEGIPVVDDVDDRLELKFNAVRDPLRIVEDKSGRIDYKDVGAVSAVKKGEVLAIKHQGTEGSNGEDIHGKIIKKRERKPVNLKVGPGCALKDENTVEAAIDGKPYVKNGMFCVFQVHEVMEDVDLKSGNIQFIGDVMVYGNVREGMKIQAGNSVNVNKNVEQAEIIAKGDITIKGNMIGGVVAAGGEDALTLSLLNALKEMKTTIMNMMDTIMEIKKYNLLGQKKSDGEIIKVLIETKFKALLKLCIHIIRDTALQSDKLQDKVVEMIKSKLIGMGPLSIRHFSELDDIMSTIDRKIILLEGQLSLPVNVTIAYCQDSTINSSGDTFITGKGEYVSKITSHRAVYFCGEKSVARGGTIDASTEIKCKIVGSPGGVSTRLSVGAKGHIWADMAYQNTIFVVGSKEYILDKQAKNLHAYLDENSDLIIDKLYF
jgi:uncharacterized protein